MLKQRIIVGVIGGIFAIVVLCLNSAVISIVLGILSLIGLSEIYNTTGILKRKNKLCLFSYLYVLTMYVVMAFLPNMTGFALALFLFAYAAVLLIYMVFNHETTDFEDLGSLFFQTAYVAFLFAHILLVRRLHLGNYLIWIVFITAWLSDTAAFAVGLKFGKNKLMPTISPKKTVEGALGGLAGSLLFNLIFGIVCSLAFDRYVNYLALIFLSLTAGALSQLGDLVASAIKREHGVKDYSSLLPGHGGVLDRFDSVLFVAPTVYYFSFIFVIFA